eukprot:1102770-Amphidinium_carterae.1
MRNVRRGRQECGMKRWYVHVGSKATLVVGKDSGNRVAQIKDNNLCGQEDLQVVLAWAELLGKAKYLEFKKCKEQWRSLALSHSKDPANKKKRALRLTSEEVAAETSHSKRTRKASVRKPLTDDAYEEFFSRRENGGFTAGQLQKQWTELVKDNRVKRDYLGVS